MPYVRTSNSAVVKKEPSRALGLGVVRETLLLSLALQNASQRLLDGIDAPPLQRMTFR